MSNNEASGSSKMNRRQFISTVGVASVTAAAALSETASALSPITTMKKNPSTPSSKPRKSNEAKMSSRSIKSQVDHASGIVLGGIGCGSIEIRPDGCFHEWQIFNTGKWAPSQPEHERDAKPDMPLSAFSFCLRTKQGSEIRMRRLSIREDQNEFYSLGWVRNVQEIDYDGQYPVANLNYLDETLPVEVSALVFSPIIPHDSRTSGTPGFNVEFTLTNTSKKAAEVSLMSLLKNPLAWNLPDRALTNEIHQEGPTTRLTMRTAAQGSKMSTIGSLSLSVTGGEASWVQADSENYLSNGGAKWTRYGNFYYESVYWEFREDGKLPSLAVPQDALKGFPTTDEGIDALTAPDLNHWVERVRRFASIEALARKIQRVEPKHFDNPEAYAPFLKVCRNWLFGEDGKSLPYDWSNGALCSSLKLKPGESSTIRFTLSWFFPHHFSERGPELGHMYENWFHDAADVNQFMVANYADHRQKVLSFVDTLFDTNLPGELPECWSSQLSTLPKCSWWTKDGKFAIWEGLGCCGLHTTDITYQGSFNIIALWPELQKDQMTMGAAYQRADGRVHHFFTPDLSQVDGGFDRVDMNPQFVMMVCRDFLWTGDKDYIKRLWPNVVRAIESTHKLDTDGDGLPDHDASRNTYDAWDLDGTPAYIASLWLGGLRAGIRLAYELGETALASQWSSLLSKGTANLDKRLWNGEYYSLWNNGEARDECCMSDQMSGEWFTNLMGIGHAIPKKRVLEALKAVVRHNFDPDLGLRNASYPDNRPARFSTYRNGQAVANWTGIEYAIASMMIDFGMFAEGLAVVQSVQDRYARGGRHWNQVECGDHYYRAMSSWATLLAVTGFKPDLPTQTLEIMPTAPGAKLIAPWFSSTGFGTLVQDGAKLKVSCKSGSLSFKKIKTLLKKPTTLTVGGKALSFKLVDGVVVLDQVVELTEGQELSLS